MRKQVLFILTAFFLTNSFFLSFSDAQTSSESPGAKGPQTLFEETAGIDELARILMEKGVLNQEDVAAMQRTRKETGLTGIDALTEMLKVKGVLSKEEAKRVSKKQAEEAQAKGKAVILYSEKPDRKALEKMTQEVTHEIKKDVRERVKAEIKEEVVQATKAEIKAAAAPNGPRGSDSGGTSAFAMKGPFSMKITPFFSNRAIPPSL